MLFFGILRALRSIKVIKITQKLLKSRKKSNYQSGSKWPKNLGWGGTWEKVKGVNFNQYFHDNFFIFWDTSWCLILLNSAQRARSNEHLFLKICQGVQEIPKLVNLGPKPLFWQKCSESQALKSYFLTQTNWNSYTNAIRYIKITHKIKNNNRKDNANEF